MSEKLSLCNFKAVLFDVDGTLVDSMAKIVNGLGDVFEKFSGKRPADEDIKALIGLPIEAQLSYHGVHPASQEEHDEMIRYTILRYEHHKHLDRDISPAMDALRICHQSGLKTALVTSKNATELAMFVPTFSAMDAVDAMVCASDVSKPKPDPECVLRACDLLGVAPREAIYVGDSIFDMRSARAAGATPVAVAYGSSASSELVQENPAMLFETPEQLLAWTRENLLQPTCRERKTI